MKQENKDKIEETYNVGDYCLTLLSDANGITLLTDKNTGQVFAVRKTGLGGFKLEALNKGIPRFFT